MGGEDQGTVGPLFEQFFVRAALKALVAGRYNLARIPIE
jgi:hypothetical protein